MFLKKRKSFKSIPQYLISCCTRFKNYAYSLFCKISATFENYFKRTFTVKHGVPVPLRGAEYIECSVKNRL